VFETGGPEERENASWEYLLVLRNQGRLREAERLNRTGSPTGVSAGHRPHTPGLHNEGILDLERGRAREAARVFARLRGGDISGNPPGIQARSRAWSGTLQGMALAAAGDTVAVRALADSVERWGAGSAYGRDRKAHHYLRGLLLVAEGRDRDAVPQFQAAIHSASLGFTRVNYELARSLVRLGRPAEAIGPIQAALRGELDASCLYVTHTALHEVLAQAFAASGQPDSAAFHYRAVVKAWHRADPEFVPRRDAAQRWLVRYQRGPGKGGSIGTGASTH
jgi:tetratricopeptide (TPR) repeat protein